MKIKKIFFGFFSFFCTKNNEFQESTDLKKAYKELSVLPNLNSDILAKIEDELSEIRENECIVCLQQKTLSKCTILHCGHEVCRECFLKLKTCPKCRAVKREYKTRFELLSEKSELRKPQKKQGKLERELSDRNMQCEVITFLLSWKLKKSIRTLLKSEMKSLAAQNTKGINAAARKLVRQAAVAYKYVRSSWVWKKSITFVSSVVNQPNLDSLDAWQGSLYMTQILIACNEISDDKICLIRSKYLTLSTYIIAVAFAALKLFLARLLRITFLDKLYRNCFLWLERDYAETILLKRQSKVTERMNQNRKLWGKASEREKQCIFFDVYHFFFIGIIDVLLLSFHLWKNPALLVQIIALVSFNGSWHFALWTVLGSFGVAASALSIILPDSDTNLIKAGVPLLCITFLFCFISKRVVVASLGFVLALPILVSALIAREELFEALSEAYERINQYIY